jgi:hypothetical protein
MATALSTLHHLPSQQWRFDGDAVLLGPRRVALADVASAEAAGFDDHDFDGQLLLAAAFCLLGALLVVAVMTGAQMRFLVGTVLLWAIAAASLQDVLRTRAVRHYRVKISLADGTSVPFSSASRVEAEALLAALRDRCPAARIAP